MNIDEPGHGTGVLMPHNLPADRLPGFARLVEELGFDTLWVPENSFLAGGIAAAGAALAAAGTLRVGIGVVPAPTRHPATLAMDVATLANTYPGRLIPGIGLGVPAWIEKMGLLPDRPVRFMGDYLRVLRRLLDGEETTAHIDGSPYRLEDIALADPPQGGLPLAIGAVGELMLKLAGRAADVAVISSLASPQYLAWAQRIIESAAVQAGRPLPRRVCFVSTSIHPDRTEALRLIRPDIAFVLGAMGVCALTHPLGIDEDLKRILAGAVPLSEAMPDTWLEQMALVGTPEEIPARVRRYLDNGATDLIFSPKPVERTAEILTSISQALGLRERSAR